MSDAQRLLAFFVVLSALAVALRTVSHRSRVPYPVVLAVGGILVGLVPGGRAVAVGSDLILLAFVVFQAAFTLQLAELRRLLTPVGLLATVTALRMRARLPEGAMGASSPVDWLVNGRSITRAPLHVMEVVEVSGLYLGSTR